MLSVKKMQIEWIFFDLGNTLYDETYSEYDRVVSLIETNKLNISPSDFLAQMRAGAAMYAPSPFAYARGHFGIKENYPYSGEKEVLFDGVTDVLKHLSAHYRLGILANQPSSTLERLKRDGIYSFFDLCLLSETENLSKPDLAFFKYAIKRATCNPGKIVMVGDRLDNDIMPAKKVGMKTVRIRQGLHAVQEPKGDAHYPDWEISSIKYLLSLWPINPQGGTP